MYICYFASLKMSPTHKSLVEPNLRILPFLIFLDYVQCEFCPCAPSVIWMADVDPLGGKHVDGKKSGDDHHLGWD